MTDNKKNPCFSEEIGCPECCGIGHYHGSFDCQYCNGTGIVSMEKWHYPREIKNKRIPQ